MLFPEKNTFTMRDKRLIELILKYKVFYMVSFLFFFKKDLLVCTNSLQPSLLFKGLTFSHPNQGMKDKLVRLSESL